MLRRRGWPRYRPDFRRNGHLLKSTSPWAVSEQGSVTVVLAAAIAGLIILVTAVFVPLNHRLALVRAQSVADLSALAGAMELHNGGGDGCARASDVLAAGQFSAIRSTCEIIGADLRVTVTVQGALRASSVVSVAGPAGDIQGLG